MNYFQSKPIGASRASFLQLLPSVFKQKCARFLQLFLSVLKQTVRDGQINARIRLDIHSLRHQFMMLPNVEGHSLASILCRHMEALQSAYTILAAVEVSGKIDWHVTETVGSLFNDGKTR